MSDTAEIIIDRDFDDIDVLDLLARTADPREAHHSMGFDFEAWSMD